MGVNPEIAKEVGDWGDIGIGLGIGISGGAARASQLAKQAKTLDRLERFAAAQRQAAAESRLAKMMKPVMENGPPIKPPPQVKLPPETVSRARQAVEAAERAATQTKTLAPTARTERLTTRAEEVHSVLDSIARKQRTTAVLETSGGDIIGGGARDLTPAQRATLRPGEIAARLPGEHAEITALQEAARRGLRPRAIVTTRDFCPDCRRVLEEAGARITGPRTAVWD